MKLLTKIGLQTLPPLTQLIDICCSSDPSVSSAALKYLLEKMSTHYPTYDPSDFSQKAYIPANKDYTTLLATPLDVSLPLMLGYLSSLTYGRLSGLHRAFMGFHGFPRPRRICTTPCSEAENFTVPFYLSSCPAPENNPSFSFPSKELVLPSFNPKHR